MGEPGRHLDLAQEPVGTNLRSQFGTQDLECDIAVMADIVRQEHERHTSLAEFTVDGVAALEGTCQAFWEVRHGLKMTARMALC